MPKKKLTIAAPSPAQQAAALNRERLRQSLPATVECLSQRRADLIDDALIEDYVALSWLEWNGGGLRLTVTGTNVCAQISAAARQYASN
jgi:hypothetical protein